MDPELATRIRTHLGVFDYSAEGVEDAIAFADDTGYSSDDEALSLALTYFRHAKDEIASGKRVEVEPGSW